MTFSSRSPSHSRRLALVCGAVALLLSGCARPVAVTSDPGASYAVEVVNRTGVALDVGFHAGGEARSLGTVAAGATERFVVVSPGSSAVTIVGTGTGVSVQQSVTLRTGETVRVVLQR